MKILYRKNMNMRRWMALLILCVGSVVSMWAQEGLEVARFFTDEYTSNSKVTMVSMSGDQLDGTGLRKFRSVSVCGDEVLFDRIEKAVRKDGAKADYKETSFKDGKLHFGFYSLGGKENARRYILYLNRRSDSGAKTTLVYIQGNLSPEEVKKIIVKKIK